MPKPEALFTAARVMAGGAALAGTGLTASAPPPVPPPVEQHTADCRRPVFATDQLVCSDPGLRELDERVAARLAADPPSPAQWVEPQWQWFQRRSRCAFSANHRACVEAAYQERLALLSSLPPPQDHKTAKCNRLEIAAVASTGTWVFLIGRAGGVLGIARRDADGKDWQPYLAASMRGPNVRIKSITGETIACRAFW